MPTFMENDPDRIPCEVVAPVLRYAFENWHVWRQCRRGFNSMRWEETTGHYIACDLLAAEFGRTADTWAKRLGQILNLNTETCSLNHVDHFLVILGQHHLWYSPPLSDYYFSPEVLAAA